MSVVAPPVTTPHDPDAAARRAGLLLVAAAAALWSTGGLIVRLLEVADLWTTVLWRSLFAALFLLGFVVWRERGRAADLFLNMGLPGLLVGACFASGSICLVVALNLTSVANTLIILATSPFVAAVLGRIWLGEQVRPRSWVAMTAALGGVAIMMSDSFARGSIAGDLVAMTIPVTFSIATVTIRRQRELRMAPATCIGAALSALIALPLAAPLAVTPADFGLLVLFGSLQLGAGLALFTTGARLAPAAEVALISVLEPILGPLWVWVLLGEHPGTAALIGGSVVLSALVLHQLLDLRRARPIPPAI